MARAQIPEGKKRYQVTLTEETVKRFQALSERLRIPRSVMSSVLDDSLLAVVESMEKFEKKGKVTIADLFTAIGEQLDKAHEEERLEKSPIDEEPTSPAKKRQAKKTT